MHIVGLDLGKRKSQVCVGTEDGTIVVEKRLPTERGSLAAFFAGLLPAKVLIEASTSAEWVARHLESIGADVVVADPRFGPMYAQLDKRIKTDKRDGRALMHALRLGAYRPAHRRQDATRDLRARLLVRSNIIRARSRMAVTIRSLTDSRGVALRACEVEHLLRSLDGAQVDEGLGDAMLPLVSHLAALDETVAELDAELAAEAAKNPIARRFDEVVGIGPLTALAFIVAVEDPHRFTSARQVASYLGFVPRESSSGEKQKRGSTTKSGDWLARSYLVQAAWSIRRSKKESVQPLRTWMLAVEERRGKKIAVTALARRLVRILWAMWRDGASFDPNKLMSGKAQDL